MVDSNMIIPRRKLLEKGTLHLPPDVQSVSFTQMCSSFIYYLGPISAQLFNHLCTEVYAAQIHVCKALKTPLQDDIIYSQKSQQVFTSKTNLYHQDPNNL